MSDGNLEILSICCNLFLLKAISSFLSLEVAIPSISTKNDDIWVHEEYPFFSSCCANQLTK